MPAISAAKSGGFCFGNSESVKLTFTVDDSCVILLIDGKMVYFAAVTADIALDAGIFVKGDARENLNAQIGGAALSDL